ncbi:MAG TPA: hypothetical protein PK605_08130 [Ignavibacteria bacterium]|nr:hypothetical protein [Ignavibacteria bacterium]HAX49253.1 hypothetical protein [Bacteroidota bacterium]HRF64585.1 hypothetical protein [Ignavibacteria bacterium]HRJ04356.1 hypothetical protein [Ignavibacteria bacterium]
MTLLELIHNQPELITKEATNSLIRVQLPHYSKFRLEEIQVKYSNLLLALTKCVETQNCNDMIGYMDLISDERFASGFEVEEIQIALNIFEEALWKNIRKYVDPKDHYASKKMVTTIVDKAKEELLNEYVTLSKS